MIHGGAGAIHEKQDYKDSIEGILAHGAKLLESGESALTAVEACVSMLEDDPLYNAGKGSVLNADGKVEMDAAIMNGAHLEAGAIAGVTNIKNPIQLARKVMEESKHVFLIGEGANQFAKSTEAKIQDDEYFIIPKRVEQLEKARKNSSMTLDHDAPEGNTNEKFGTVGAVARDLDGNLAAATSTGGLVNKKFGRVGDSPIVGSGVYADNETCAVSATGFGEHFLRTALAKEISSIIAYQKVAAPEAAQLGIDYLVRKVEGLGGVIVIDADGNCGDAISTPDMIRGSVREGSDPQFR